MILPGVSVLVRAFRADSLDHKACRAWLDGIVNGDARYGISPQVLNGIIRVTTHPRVFAQPSHIREALGFCRLLFEQPHCMAIQPGERHWDIFARLCTEADAKGNLVPDAWFGALAIEAGCEWITLDRDFTRFPGLHWNVPS